MERIGVMTQTFMNIPYELDNPFSVAEPRFISIWKVIADDSYRVWNADGFANPGIFLTYEGSGTLQLWDGEEADGRKYELSASTYMPVDRKIACRYQCEPGGKWKFYFLHFSDLGMANDLRLAHATLGRTGRMAYLINLCEDMIETIILRKTAWAHSVNQAFRELLLSLAREQAEREQPHDPAIARTLYWMHQNLDKPLRIEDLVGMSNLSRTHFFHRFKSATGKTPAEYFTELKLESAKIALRTTNLPIRTISDSLHFYDEYYFSKLFKKRFGVAPSLFRKMN
jgi:AraC-like DNA-binding protein